MNYIYNPRFLLSANRWGYAVVSQLYEFMAIIPNSAAPLTCRDLACLCLVPPLRATISP